MTAKMRFLGLCVLGLTVIAACAKKTDYVYYSNPPKAVVLNHKIKELSGNSQLDILWVIDNSGSMGIHQQDVINNANSFVDGLVQNSTLQWKMGLISTTINQPPFVGFMPGDELDYTMPNGAQRFKSAVGRLGLSGSGVEEEYDPILSAFRSYPNFLRPNAYLAIIVVTDAPEQSLKTTTEFISQMTGIKGKLSNVLVYAFVNPVDWCSPTDDTFNWQGSKLQVLLTQVQGSAYKLCDPAFGKNIANLGANLASRATSPRIDLKDQPILSTLKVWHGNKEVPAGPRASGGYWEYDVRANAVIFSDLSFAPNDNETVRVTYEIDQN